MRPHGYGFKPDICTADPQEMRKWIAWADVVNVHRSFHPLDTAGFIPKHLIMTHHGTYYRRYVEACQAANVRYGVKHVLCTTADLAKYGYATWLPTAIPVDQYAAMRVRGTGKPVICQTPSYGFAKDARGSRGIFQVLGGRTDIKLVITERIPHVECLRCKASADIVIDRFFLGLGVSGLEALAMSIPVIADASEEDEACIRREVGFLPYYSAAVGGVEAAVDVLLSNKSLYDEYAERGYEYVKRFHDFPAVAKMYIEICAQVLLEAWDALGIGMWHA